VLVRLGQEVQEVPRRVAPATEEEEEGRRPKPLEFVLQGLGWVFLTFVSLPVLIGWMLSTAIPDLARAAVRGLVPAALVVLAVELVPWWPLQALSVVAGVSMLTFLTFTLLLARDLADEQPDENPFVSLLTVLVVATGVFSAATFALVEHGRLTVENWQVLDSRMGAAVGFYVWQFLDAIPLLNAPETLRWDEPLEYDDGWLGALVLLFKIAIIIPIVGAMRTLLQGSEEPHAVASDEPARPQPG
jgi:hypothetical protein